MNINQVAQTLAGKYGFNAEEFKEYITEDTVGGWDEQNDGEKTRTGNPLWPVGSIWEIEGQILYALVRILKPKNIYNLGHGSGCSYAHLLAAVKVNGNGIITSVDLASPKDFKESKRFKFMKADVFDFKFPTSPKVDFVFEDVLHSAESINHVWSDFKKRGKKGAMIVSHDSEHYLQGAVVREGIEQITDDYVSLLPEPAKCGLAFWRKP